MPRRQKGARLWLRPAWRSPTHDNPAVWLIRDGRHQESTGCGADDHSAAEQALGRYIARKHIGKAATGGPRHIDRIPIADVIAVYIRDVAPTLARPEDARSRARMLFGHLGERLLSDINGAACRAYVAARGSVAAAKRELEDLRAAINHYHREGLSHEIVAVTLPPRSPGRERWLTRSEAARLLWAAWRYREQQNRRGTGRRTRRHIARFILIALYTGSRAGVITSAALQPTAGHGWIDLDRGVFYRRPEGERETRKRRPAARVPGRLLAHIRRWKRHGARYAVEWNAQPVVSIRKAFAAVVADAGLDAAVTPHVLRHTAVTWAMENAADRYQAGEFFGLSQEMLEERYGHHHPDHQKSVAEAIAARPHQERNKTRRHTGGTRKQRNKARKIVDLVAKEP